jgi:pyrroloquinoline quinone (PQQ) biosynthesis protein C
MSVTFFQRLQQETEVERQYLLASPLITAAVEGEITHEEYVAFLGQAYHHVKHTTPLLMAVGSRIPESAEWLRDKIAHYIEEEVGHQEWILNDIRACGADAEAVRGDTPSLPVELMISFIWDFVSRRNPVGFFGMVYVLEGTSVNVATQAADKIRGALGLPKNAFSYLYSHGSLDIEHIDFFENIVNRIDDKQDQSDIIHVAKIIFRLYADMFRSIKPGDTH